VLSEWPKVFRGNFCEKLEMSAHQRAGQSDGRRHHADDFRGWVKTMVLFLAVSGPKFMKFWDDVGDPS